MIDNDISSMYPNVITFDPTQKVKHFKPAKFRRVRSFFYDHPKIGSTLAAIWKPIGITLFYLLTPLWWVLARTWLKEDAAFILQNVYWLFEEPWKW